MLIQWADASDYIYFRNYLNRISIEKQKVMCIQQDSKGFIWYSTDDGIYRFDGNQNYKLNQIFKDMHSLYENYQPYFFISSTGKMILSGGDVVNLNSNIFEGKIYPFYNGMKIMEDDAHNIWIPLEHKRILIENLFSNKRIVYKGYDVKNADITSNNYFFTSPNGKICRVPLGFKSKYYVIAKSPIVTSFTNFCCLNDEEILCSTDKKGLYLIHVNNGKLEKIKDNLYVRDIKNRNSQECWIATETGIYIYNSQNRSFSSIKKNTINPNALQDNVEYSLFRDFHNGMWIGHYFKGISYVPLRLCNFEVSQSMRTDFNLQGNVFREFCSDNSGNIWIGTEDSGLNCFSPSTNTYINYSPMQPDKHINTVNVHALTVIGNNLWIGSFDDGIDVMDLKSKRIVNHFEKGDGSGLTDNFTFTVLSTPEFGILVGTHSGVLQYNGSTHKFNKFPYAGPYEACPYLYADSKNRLWMCRREYLECVYPNGKKITFRVRNKNNANSIMEDHLGRLWIATTNGIAYYEEKYHSFITQKISDNKATNCTFRILEDNNDNLWISTSHGLVMYNPQTKSKKIFSTYDGLPTNIFNECSSFKDKNGKLYFGTIDGYISFYPQSVNLNQEIPELAFTQLIASGTALSDTIFYGENRKHKPVFAHNQNSISVNFAALQYVIADGLDFQYYLEGIEHKWHILHGYNTITYPSLPPGKYKLHLRSTDAKGRWANNKITYAFVIEPPFYLSNFAILIYLILVGYAGYYAYQQTKKRVRARHFQQIDAVNRIKEKELYNTKINFFTTIVHEIRTPLTLIKTPLENVLEVESNEDKLKNLKLIERNTDRLSTLCTQLLNFRKMESSQLQLNFVMTDINQLITDIQYNFTGTIQEKGIKYDDNLKDVHIEAAVDKEAFTKIISNLLNNACKYAASLISLQISDDDKNFSVRISSDGELIAPKEHEKIFSMFYRANVEANVVGTGIGLPYCRTLAEMHKGSIELVDGEPSLNVFLLTLPKHQEMEFREVYTTDTIDNEVYDHEESNTEKKNILIVEDEPEMRHFIADSLSRHYKVFKAANGLRAIEILEKKDIDLVVTDVMMPKMNGCELCKKIKDRMEWSSIPVVMLTAKVNVEARLEGYAAGAEDYIDKPFSMKYLSSRLEDILKKSYQRIKSMEESTDTDSMVQNIVNRTDRAFISSFISLIKEEIGNDQLDAEMISKRLQVSPSTLYRRCKQLLDTSPVEYIRIERLKKAKQLLEIEDVRISDVAYEVGFSTPSYFTLCFSKEFGISPTDYIRQTKETKSMV